MMMNDPEANLMTRQEGGFDDERFPQVISMMDPPELTENVVRKPK